MWAISAVDRPARIGHTTTKRLVTAGCGQLFVLAPTLPDYGHPGQDGLVFGLVITVAVSVTVLYHWKFVVVVCINNITVNG